MGQPMGLDGVIALEIEKGLNETVAGRIAVDDGGDVGAEAGGDFRVCLQRALENGDDLRGGDEVIGQPAGDPMNDRVLQTVAIEDRRAQKPGERGLALEGVLGLFQQFAPERIVFHARTEFVLRFSRGGDQGEMARFRRHVRRSSISTPGRRISGAPSFEGGSLRLFGPLEKAAFVHFPRRAFGEMRLGKSHAFERPKQLLRGEKMKSLAGVVAGDDACGSSGDLNHISLGHD